MPHGDQNMDIMTECHNICLETVSHCLQMGGNHARPEHITVLLDCAEICQLSANFMLRKSNLHALSCATCAEICDRCAQSCDGFRDEADQTMKQCAEICRRCAEACRRMASGFRVERRAAN